MKAFKVVDETRYGSNISLARIRGKWKNIKSIIDQHPNLFPKYEKGTILTADPSTEGFYIFLRKRDAKQFIDYHNLKNALIIKVQPLKRCNLKIRILVGSSDLKYFILNYRKTQIFVNYPYLTRDWKMANVYQLKVLS